MIVLVHISLVVLAVLPIVTVAGLIHATRRTSSTNQEQLTAGQLNASNRDH